MIVDKPLSELEQYRPALTRQDDFDAFWEQTLSESANQPLNVALEEIDYPVERVRVYDVRYDGFGEATRVAGWYLVPRDRLQSKDGRTPTIVIYHGYTGGRGLPASYLQWALQGYCVLTVDTRGQDGVTPDNHVYNYGSAVGFMTKGINDPYNYYYRYVYMDCVRAVDVARSLPEVGPIAITGGSQGGALTLAVAALAQDKGIVAAMSDVPFLSHFRRAIEVYCDGPYGELVHYWKTHPDEVEKHYRTLSYIDCMNLAPRITCPLLMSTALLDTICPSSTNFAVYNHAASQEKEIRVYPFNGHEGGGVRHDEVKYRFVQKYFGLR